MDQCANCQRKDDLLELANKQIEQLQDENAGLRADLRRIMDSGNYTLRDVQTVKADNNG